MPANSITYPFSVRILKAIPWLEEEAEAIEHLLSKVCATDQEREFITQMLEACDSPNLSAYSRRIESLAKIIAAESLPTDTTALVACDLGKSPDSASSMLQHLKLFTHKHGWKTKSMLKRSPDVYRKLPALTHIVLLDDFVGTGSTVSTCATALKEQIKRLNLCSTVDVRIRIATAMEAAIERLIAEKWNVKAATTLKSGIPKGLSRRLRTRKIRLMQQLETRLAKLTQPTYSKFRFGWGRAQALHCVERFNVPNSVYPVLWWQLDSTGRECPAIFRRTEEDLPW